MIALLKQMMSVQKQLRAWQLPWTPFELTFIIFTWISKNDHVLFCLWSCVCVCWIFLWVFRVQMWVWKCHGVYVATRKQQKQP